MSGTILTAVDASIATLTFHNPERHNSVSLQMWKDAASALERFAEDESVRVVVLTGSGAKSFASGADISEFDQVRSDAQAAAVYDTSLDRFWTALSGHPKPTIAMIRGFCIGGGLNIAACCDVRVCGASSRFAVPAAKLGLGYGVTTLKRLVALVGPQFALEILLTARQFSSDESFAMGLVNRVVPDNEVESPRPRYGQRHRAQRPPHHARSQAHHPRIDAGLKRSRLLRRRGAGQAVLR